MTELLIGAVSWLATLGFIVAAIVEAFRWPRRAASNPSDGPARDGGAPCMWFRSGRGIGNRAAPAVDRL